MTALHTLQALLALSGILGLWFAMSCRSGPAGTMKIVVAAALSAAALVATQVVPLVWLTLSGVAAEATITRVECAKGQKHYVQFEFPAGSTDPPALG